MLADAADPGWCPPACSDGIDNDGDGKIDYAGGPLGQQPDGMCQGNAAGTTETEPACGIGFELVFALAPLHWLRRRRHRI